MSPSLRRAAARALIAILVMLSGRAVAAQDSAPSDAEHYERTLREERTRHLESVRKLGEDEDRLRVALDAARNRLSEADARRASLSRLVADAEAMALAIEGRLAAARHMLDSVQQAIERAARRLAERSPAGAPVQAGLVREGSAVRRVRLMFQVLDREVGAARLVSASARERGGVLGHEVRLGAVATFFVPTGAGPAILEPSGRSLPEPVGVALREIVGQLSRRGRGTLVLVPWWGAP